MDGSGKFVLQIRRPQYWRIEVPSKSDDDKVRVEELKEVLAKVLLFEKTPCPFQRNFTVELPDPPQTPVRKRPWKPVERPRLDITPTPKHADEENSYSAGKGSSKTQSLSTISELVSTPTTPSRDPASSTTTTHTPGTPSIADLYPPNNGNRPELSSSPDSKQKEDETVLPDPFTNTISDKNTPAGILAPSLLESSVNSSRFGSSSGLEEDSDNFSDTTDDTNVTVKVQSQPALRPTTSEPNNDDRPQAVQNRNRLITDTPVLSIVTSSPSKSRTNSPLRNSTVVESNPNFSSSVESFHSVQSWHSPLAPPSPPTSHPSSPTTTTSYPYPHDNIVLPKRPHHTRDTSELTTASHTPGAWETTSIDSGSVPRSLSPPPKTPTLVNDTNEKSDDEQFEVITPPTARSGLRHRATTSSNSRRRTLSPLPAAVNLFSPPKHRLKRLQTTRHLPTAIIQKTCEILLSPPSHLLQLMLNIASKIAAGEWKGVLSGNGEDVHWDFEDEYVGEGWTEDDYGMSLPNTEARPKKANTKTEGGFWEVD